MVRLYLTPLLEPNKAHGANTIAHMHTCGMVWSRLQPWRLGCVCVLVLFPHSFHWWRTQHKHPILCLQGALVSGLACCEVCLVFRAVCGEGCVCVCVCVSVCVAEGGGGGGETRPPSGALVGSGSRGALWAVV
jgi:hypothetical protein